MVGTIAFFVVGIMAVGARSFLSLILFILTCSNYLEWGCEAGQGWRV